MFHVPERAVSCPHSALPRPRVQTIIGTFFAAGFRPFFLSAALWAAVGLPLSIAYFEAAAELPTRFSLSLWHSHEMAFGFDGAVVAGFLLTAIPNWTGRMPLQGAPLAGLVALWLLGRIAVLVSATMPAPVAAALDLVFPTVFFLVSRERSRPGTIGATSPRPSSSPSSLWEICSLIST